jgi:predicted nucleic acid-binding protein
MRVLLDTNIVVDVLLKRKLFFEEAVALLELTSKKSMQVFLTATTITDIYYLSKKNLGNARALEQLNDIVNFYQIASVDKLVIENALSAGFSDFEDAVQHEAAVNFAIDIIVSRNTKDFRKSTLPVYTPAQFVVIHNSKK